MPRLNNLDIRLKTMRVDNYTTIEKLKPHRRNIIHIQPQITGGYDIINKQWGITVGIGIGIDI